MVCKIISPSLKFSIIIIYIFFLLGCVKCFPDREIVLAGGRTAGELYNATQKRLMEIEAKNIYKIKTIWECAFQEKLQQNPTLKAKYESVCLAADEPLNARSHCLRGGRVEPFKLYHKCEKDEEIIYVDVVSCFFQV